MKKLLILGFVLSFLSCTQETVDYVLFTGKIENAKGEKVTILQQRDLIKDILLNPDGTFSDTLRVEKGFYSFSHGRERTSIYLEPGKTLDISLNTETFDESIVYKGTNGENNNYLVAKLLDEEKNQLNYVEVFSMEENNFLSKVAEIKEHQTEFLEGFENIDSDFKTLEEKNIKYNYLILLENYSSYHGFYAKKKDFTPSDNLQKKLSALDYNDSEQYKMLANYKSLVQRHYMSKIEKSDNPSDAFKEVNALDFPALKKDLTTMLDYEISPNNKHNEAYYNGLLDMSNDEDYKKALTLKYDKVKKLVKGMPSPEFVDYENHKGGKTSLKDLRGKYVYIDVWATWCGPCLREIPSLKEVEEKYHDKNITFVSTSIDRAKDHTAWVNMVNEKELGGIQLFADNNWASDFVKKYAIEGIPRFIVIDPNGNIVDADAPRPSSPELIELFESLDI